MKRVGEVGFWLLVALVVAVFAYGVIVNVTASP
jgi:hypothetical protein